MCLVDNFRKVSEGCQSEMSRAVRIALWDYKPGAGLTMACDSDVTSQCPKVRVSPRVRQTVRIWICIRSAASICFSLLPSSLDRYLA